MTNRGNEMGRLTRILCALALILVGFAHKPPHVVTTVPASEVAAYTLPDGTVPMLCDLANLADDDHDHGPSQGPLRCEACLLSASTLAPPPPGLAVPPLRLAGTFLPQDLDGGPATAFRLTAAPRGPPPFLA